VKNPEKIKRYIIKLLKKECQKYIYGLIKDHGELPTAIKMVKKS